jgi:receptor protein-tyrosine kinase/non-specific protein-tyrosine kinase
MSKIEKAMERAAQIRQGKVVPAAFQSEQPEECLPIHTPPPIAAATERIVPNSPFLINMNDPHSSINEEFRKLKTELLKLTKGDTLKNTVQITSAVPHEGKSLTALNLAISLAQEYDHTVLLIDADFRRPSIHSYLGIEQKKGFSDCLLGEAEIGDVLIPTGIGRLSVITSGHEVPNPAELFASQKTAALIADIKNRYHDRFIIFDSPPVLPFAESRTLAHLVDGVLFVVKEQLASQNNVKEAISALKGCGLLGMVYNDVVIDRHDEKYTSYHNYAQAGRYHQFPR